MLQAIQNAQALLERDQQAERAVHYMTEAKQRAEGRAKELEEELAGARAAKEKAESKYEVMRERAEKAESDLRSEAKKAEDAIAEMGEMERSLAQVVRERDAERAQVEKMRGKLSKFAKHNYSLGSDYGYRLAKRKVLYKKEELSDLKGDSAEPDSHLSAVSSVGEEVDGPERMMEEEEVGTGERIEEVPSVDELFAAAEVANPTDLPRTEAEEATGLIEPIADDTEGAAGATVPLAAV